MTGGPSSSSLMEGEATDADEEVAVASRSTWMLALGVSGGLALVVGIPLFALTTPSSTEMADGRVLSVDTAGRSLTIHDISGAAALRGRELVVHLPAGERVRLARGGEPLGAVIPGQRVRARIGTRSAHIVRWVALDG